MEISFSPDPELYPFASRLLELWRRVPERLAGKPVLLTWGMRDFAFPPKSFVPRIRKVFADVDLVELPRAKHFIQEDAPDEIAEAIAALLHDAAEDQGGAERLADIRDRFGDRVAGIVEACSDTLETPKPPWPERKGRYVEHLRTAPPEVLRVALADKLHNAGSILRDYREVGERLWERFNAPRDEVLAYHRSLVEVFRAHRPGPRTDELAAVVAELERLAGPVRSAGRPPRETRPEEPASEAFFRRLLEPPPGRPGFLERLVSRWMGR